MIMLSLVILLAAALVSKEVHCATQAVDLDAILDILEAQKTLPVSRSSDTSSDSDSSDSTSSDRENTLRSGNLVRLLHKTLDDAMKKKETKHRQSKLNRYKNYNRVSENNLQLVSNKDVSNEEDNNLRLFERFLESLLTKNDNDDNKVRTNKALKQKLKPSALMEPYKDVSTSDLGSLNEYSRIYLILNPEALSSSQNKKQLTDLISRLLANSPSASQNSDRGLKESRYQLLTSDGLSLRRYKKDSAEGPYVARSSMEDNYKKRPRYNSYGGGGAGGRTAIPVVRNRGDIYVRERD